METMLEKEGQELKTWLISMRGNWPKISKAADVTMRTLYNIVVIGVMPRRRTVDSLKRVRDGWGA